MAKDNEALYAFNRGLVSALSIARVDVKRVALSAEEQTNFVPRVMGAMKLRPGLQYIVNSYAATRYLPFVFAVDDTALIELSAGQMCVVVNDALVTRPIGTDGTLYGTATADFGNWTSYSEAGGVTSSASDIMTLSGNGTGAGIREQAVAFSQAGVHAIEFTVSQGSVTLRIGSATGLDDLVVETVLTKGVHNIAFTTTTGSIYVRVSNRSTYPAKLSYIAWTTSGILTLDAPWVTSQNLTDIRYEQSGDVVFVASSGVRQMRIERRPNSSWSVVDYVADNGPFRLSNTSTTTITASALSGAITLTASRALFKSTHVGALFRLISVGQNIAASLAATSDATNPIRVTGTGADRAFTRVVSGTWTGTLTLQRSIGEVGLWTDVAGITNGTVAFNDTFDNQIIYYRVFLTTLTTGGPISVTLSYPVGSISGIARVTAYISSTAVSAAVATDFGSVVATADWSEGEWSDYRGFPSAVALHGGRMWWAGKDKQWASESDAYSSFSDETEGDSGPISRSIGIGPVDKIRWLLSADHLLMGGQGSEFTVKSSQLDEPITPTNYNLKSYTGRGSGSLSGVAVDSSVLFVDRSESRVFELAGDQYGRYAAVDITAIVPEVCAPSVVRLVVQRLPDTRVHAVLTDGTVALLVYDKQEEVRCWTKIVTDGLVQDAVVTPGTDGEDKVYYKVQRTVGGSPVYFLEKLAKESESLGGTTNKMADAFVAYAGAATATITGLGHLNGRTVTCWADGIDRGTFVVAGGSITLPAPTVTNAVVGLTYRGRFKSTRLGYNVQGVNMLSNQHRKRVTHVSLLLANTHAQGLKYGTDFDYLDDMPLYEDGALVGADTVHTTYINDPIELNGTIDVSTQLCLEANAPRPCTVLGAIVSID